MKNKIEKITLALALSLSVVSMPIYAKEDEKTYDITYSPGLLGKFKESLINDYKKAYGTDDVSVSRVTDSVTIEVSNQEAMPNAPTANDIEFKDPKDATQYYVKSGWQPSSVKVIQNETYVVQYGALVEGVDYTIRYVDEVTNVDIATPVMGKANVNETIAAYAKIVEGYTFDTQTKTKVLVENAEQNVITFYYAAEDDTIYVDKIVENVIPGDVVVVREEVEGPAGGTQATLNSTPEGEDIPDNPTPLGNLDDNDRREDIEDDPTPRSKLDDDLKKNNTILYTSIGVVAVLAILLGLFLAMKKKKAE